MDLSLNDETSLEPRICAALLLASCALLTATPVMAQCTTGPDADGDRVPDSCDECSGLDDRRDCNFNGVADCVEPAGFAVRPTVQLPGPICPGAPHEDTNLFYYATSDVTVTFQRFFSPIPSAPGDYLELFVSGVSLGRFYEGQGNPLVISRADWNALSPVPGVPVPVQVTANTNGGCLDGIPLVGVITWSYTATFDADGDGLFENCLTDCRLGEPDADGDGTPNACDPCADTISGHPYIDEVGCPFYATPADQDRDGDVDQEDVAGFLGCDAGPGVAPNPSCATFDFFSDHDVDLHDYLALQDAASGSNVLAEIESAGGVVPSYLLIDAYASAPQNNIPWVGAERYSRMYYGSRLATVDASLTTAEQRVLIDEMTAIAFTAAPASLWIGLRFDETEFLWAWSDGQYFCPPHLRNLCPDSVDVDNYYRGDQLPGSTAYVGGWTNFCMAATNDTGYQWVDLDPSGDFGPFVPNAKAWLMDAPPIVAGSEEHLNPATLDVWITAVGTATTITVPVGQPVTYEVRGVLDSGGNEGLAGFAFDLSFDGGALPPASVPPGLESFAAPLGYANPAGFGGTPINGDLVQVGGGQNTPNNADPAGPTGAVVTGVGRTEVVLATGTVVAPTTPGTYTLSLSNLTATTINPNETGPVFRSEPALPGAVTSLVIIVEAGGSSCDFAVEPVERVVPYTGTDAGKGGTGLRLTSMGRFSPSDGSGPYSVWRIRNGSEVDRSTRIEGYGSGWAHDLVAPARTETFLMSPFVSGSATHGLFHAGQQIDVKAGSPSPYVSSICP